uniref:Uncharacterized protein n=1 Tax=Escherichia coli TaxID=562 RepID=A0A075MBG9_ECOLX|nr:hypothetical protein [Escherichia coli]
MQGELQATLFLFFFHHLSFSCQCYKNTQLRFRVVVCLNFPAASGIVSFQECSHCLRHEQ